MLKATHEVEVVPAKTVATRKPDKRKARFVACGNYSDVSTGGIDSTAIRALVQENQMGEQPRVRMLWLAQSDGGESNPGARANTNVT